MKKSLNLLFAIILIVAMNSCSKDEQARYKKVIILERTGQEIVKWEEYIKTHRSTLNPEAYDSLGEVAANATVLVVMNELKPDSGVESKSGDIPRVIGEVIDYQWKHPKKSNAKVIKNIRLGVQDDVYRVFTGYSEYLLEAIKGYVSWFIIGDQTQGIRDNPKEEEIKNIVNSVNPKNKWQMTFRDEFKAYYISYAKDPDNKGKPKRQAFLNLGWFD